jgi:hypothetical protein
MSETASFVDPVFLARFGLSRVNVMDYFLHPLNPFRTHANTSNEVLAMQGISIGMFIQAGTNGIPLTPQVAEEEYEKALTRIPGEQYQLLPPEDPILYQQPSPLYTIRYVNRSNPNTIKILGVYYVVEGVIYKSPAIRSLMKANVARTLDGLGGAGSALSVCARYLPSTGYTWNFEDTDADTDTDPVSLMKLSKRMKRRKILDHRKVGERNEAEEEGLRASAAIDQILVRLSKSAYVTNITPAHHSQMIAVAEPPPSANSSTTGILSSPKN